MALYLVSLLPGWHLLIEAEHQRVPWAFVSLWQLWYRGQSLKVEQMKDLYTPDIQQQQQQHEILEHNKKENVIIPLLSKKCYTDRNTSGHRLLYGLWRLIRQAYLSLLVVPGSTDTGFEILFKKSFHFTQQLECLDFIRAFLYYCCCSRNSTTPLLRAREVVCKLTY